MLWVWFGTGYKIKEGIIKIKAGPFGTTVKINDIKKVKCVSNSSSIGYLSGPALAFDKLQVTYGNRYEIVNISPKNENDFLKILIIRNANIEIEERIT